ncbi:hypothetical protein [Citrobacter portucalensis]|uniref:hypothetical protein n=1 Tax=Citrobacter portucalensis TaxID=1639133 RepID=UPI001F17987C|nr:hypothetical protein [Citrobacter portucalensis]MCE9893836.1 hypothetical protein [Citrobacter portucalensis]
MTVYEMEGFLRGKCLPGDMKVNESNAQYLVRKFSELQSQNAELAVQLANAESKCRELAAENAVKHEFIKTCFRAAADGASMDGDDIQKLGERLGLFGSEIYQPVLHGYICGHEAGEDTVYVMKKTPKTDVFLAEVRAQARTDFIGRIEWIIRNECNPDKTEAIISELQKFSDELKLEAAQ